MLHSPLRERRCGKKARSSLSDTLVLSRHVLFLLKLPDVFVAVFRDDRLHGRDRDFDHAVGRFFCREFLEREARRDEDLAERVLVMASAES